MHVHACCDIVVCAGSITFIRLLMHVLSAGTVFASTNQGYSQQFYDFRRGGGRIEQKSTVHTPIY